MWTETLTLADKWFDRYREQAPDHPLVWILVPVSVIGLTGLFWSLPVPASFRDAGSLNWGVLFLMAAVVYYFILSIRLAFGALPFVMLVAIALVKLEELSLPLWLISGVLLLLGCGTLALRERSEGRRARPLHDLLYLMIGPLWLLAALYRRLGIPY